MWACSIIAAQDLFPTWKRLRSPVSNSQDHTLVHVEQQTYFSSLQLHSLNSISDTSSAYHILPEREFFICNKDHKVLISGQDWNPVSRLGISTHDANRSSENNVNENGAQNILDYDQQI